MDGSVIRYVRLAHNRRVEGVIQAELLFNLGREGGLDREGLARLLVSINRSWANLHPAQRRPTSRCWPVTDCG